MPNFTSTSTVPVRTFGDAGQYAGLPLPGGGTIGEKDADSLRRILAPLVPGAGTMGRDVLCHHYADLLKRVHNDAGNAAVEAWLQSKKENPSA